MQLSDLLQKQARQLYSDLDTLFNGAYLATLSVMRDVIF